MSDHLLDNTELDFDPLLRSLAQFASLYHRPVSMAALTAGLPVEPGSAGPELFTLKNAKGLFSRVAARAGFSSRLIHRPLAEFGSLLLPCILILRDGRSCILEAVDRQAGMARIILPELDDGVDELPLEQLEAEYLGYAFLLKRLHATNSRQQEIVARKSGHWLWGTLWRSREFYSSVLLASLLINLFVLATPLFTMNVYDRVVPNHALDTLWVLVIGVGLVFVFDVTLKFIRSWFIELAGKKGDIIMSSLLFEHTLNLRMDQWPKAVGSFANRLQQFESIRNFITASTLVTLIDLPFVLLFLAVIAYIGGPLVLVPITTITLLVIYSLLIVKPLSRLIEATYEANANKHALLVESLHSIGTIKTLGIANHTQWEWEEASGDIAEKSMRSRMLSGSITVVSQLLVQLTTIGIVVVGVYLLAEQALSLGGLIAAVILGSRAIAPIGQLAALISNYQQTRTAFESLQELMDKQVERQEGREFVRPPAFSGQVQFNKVNFSYPESPRAALNQISIEIRPGEKVGIIGRLGSGKSSIVRLLAGLYQPDSGDVRVDGLDLRQIDPAELRRAIAWLSQDIELFRGTIRDNILLKSPHASDAAMLAAARLGGVDLFINRLPMGYDTPVGEGGRALSGGQRQCIALARSLLLESDLIVLDEPSNSMDSTTEQAVRLRLQEYLEDRTLLLITHKASMLELVDRLIVIDDGRVLLDGHKDKVLKQLQGGAGNGQ